ncbi:MAG: hypothetical protein J7K65_04265 [Planctomycetes bacterium]|nr:hypothetical protein [Planctomycetota bacterium]
MTELTDKVAKLWKNSSNSSKPPSSDIVKPPRKKNSNGSRSRGGQPGWGGPEQGETLLIATDRFDLEADVIALIFKHR